MNTNTKDFSIAALIIISTVLIVLLTVDGPNGDLLDAIVSRVNCK